MLGAARSVHAVFVLGIMHSTLNHAVSACRIGIQVVGTAPDAFTWADGTTTGEFAAWEDGVALVEHQCGYVAPVADTLGAL